MAKASRFRRIRSFALSSLAVSLLWVTGCSGIGGGSYLPGATAGTVGNCSTPAYADSYAWDVLVLTNIERDKQGLDPLAWDDTLAQAASNHCCDMINRNFFAHENPDGQNVADRVDTLGYAWLMVGENLAAGQTTPEEVVDGWMNSPGHRANILRPEFTELGVSYREGGSYSRYWVQVFAQPAN